MTSDDPRKPLLTYVNRNFYPHFPAPSRYEPDHFGPRIFSSQRIDRNMLPNISEKPLWVLKRRTLTGFKITFQAFS